MNQIKRIFSAESYKGSKGYLDTQKKYEWIRTGLYFGISLALLLMGYWSTKTKMNLLTIVAVLGFLPAAKSMVGAIMFMRFKSCPKEIADQIEVHEEGFVTLHDMVFTAYNQNFNIGHMSIRGNTVIAFDTTGKINEDAFCKHMDTYLKADNFIHVTVKLFKDPLKYMERMDAIRELAQDLSLSTGIKNTLLSIAL